MKTERSGKRQVMVWSSAEFFAAIGAILETPEWRGYTVSDYGQHLVRLAEQLPATSAGDRVRERVMSVRLNGHLHGKLKAMARERGCTTCEAMRRLLASAAGRI